MLTSVTGPLYISGPMTNLPEYNYPAFRLAKRVLTSAGYEALIPELAVEKYPELPTSEQYRAVLLRDIACISHIAHGIVLLPGFAVSPGATCELSVALALNLPVYGYLGPMPGDGDIWMGPEPIVELQEVRRLRYLDLWRNPSHEGALLAYQAGEEDWERRDIQFTKAHCAWLAKRTI